MPGKHITDQQVRRYMQSRKDGYGQATGRRARRVQRERGAADR
jgi:hypothetical protein